MLRAQARTSFRVLDQRGSLLLTPRVQTASISSSARIIASSRRQNLIPSLRSSTTTAIIPASTARAMSTHYGESAVRPEPDKVVQDIANYVHDYKINSDLAWETARLCLIDTIGCGLEALHCSPECRNLLGPVVEGTVVPNGEPPLPHRRVGPTHPPLQERKSPGPTTSSTQFEERSTSGPSSVGSTIMTASSLQNVRAVL
jgi:2-methylcitrate dehydratase